FPALAALGSVAGATVTFFIGARIGEKGLGRWVEPRRLQSVRNRLGKHGVMALALAALLPPPFPFAPVVLTGGALGLNRRKSLAALGAMRFVRFGIEAVLALIYGSVLVDWLDSEVFKAVIAA